MRVDGKNIRRVRAYVWVYKRHQHQIWRNSKAYVASASLIGEARSSFSLSGSPADDLDVPPPVEPECGRLRQELCGLEIVAVGQSPEQAVHVPDRVVLEITQIGTAGRSNGNRTLLIEVDSAFLVFLEPGLEFLDRVERLAGALARQKEKYPALEPVAERIEDYDNRNIGYEKTKELLTTYPNLRGIQGSASTTASGAGLAVEERGLQDKVMVIGTGLVAQCRQFLESNSVKLISFWFFAPPSHLRSRSKETESNCATLW